MKLSRYVPSPKKLTLASLLIVAASVSAQPEGPSNFAVERHTIDGGGGVSSGGSFILTGTIGQHDASLDVATGSSLRLAGGFWVNFGGALFRDGFEDL